MLYLLYVVVFFVSIYLILKGSDWITDSSVEVAKRLGTSNLAVGLILISVLLSLPEIVISFSAVMHGHPALGFGTVLGSVIVNIGLVIGLSALIRPLHVPRIMVTRDMIYMTVVSIVVVALALEDMTLGPVDGIVLLLLFIPYVINVYEQERNLHSSDRHAKTEKLIETLKMHGEIKTHPHVQSGLKYMLWGSAAIIVGSELFLQVLMKAASELDLPELLVGVTLGALGPSIPNLAAALGAARKGAEELVISETLGSNIFTLLVTLGILSLTTTQPIDSVTAWITAPALILVTFTLLFPMVRGYIHRKDGLILVMIYISSIIAEFMFRIKN
ncbi:MAG: sodium:calcium antiporter [Candidatus Altiarchaeota archaeon]|nr:sodium:calcium antiporter [Candidatus Altiarchaeota archaeon]